MPVNWTEHVEVPPPRVKPAGPSVRRQMQLAKSRELAVRAVRLKREGLRLYKPLPPLAGFHSSRAHWRLVTGSNRAGKTLSVAAEIARAVCGCDPYKKYPKRGGRVLVVGGDVDHLGNPMWQTLAAPGAFHTIKEQDGSYRVVRWCEDYPMQLEEDDAARRSEWRPSEPLIPARMIREISWEERKRGIPRKVMLNTDWEILFRSGGSDPPRGIQLDLVWFDEEFDNQQFYSEGNARLVDRNGVGIWSATPDASTPQLAELYERATEEEDPGVEVFEIRIADNPYLSKEAKEEFYRSLTSEEDRDIKYYGKFTLFGRRVYSCYRPNEEHGCEPFAIPEDWCRYVFIDPGRQRTGTVLAAVDPKEEHLWVYHVFALKNSDANRWADVIAELQGDFKFEAMVIDQRMGRQRPAGMGNRSVAEQYWQALIDRKVEPRMAGPLAGFFAGSDDIMYREEALLAMMRVRELGPFVGSPRLKVFKNVPTDFHKEIKEAHYDRKNPDKRKKLRISDLVESMEYGASVDPRYNRPEKVPEALTNPAERMWKKKQERKRQRTRRNLVAN